MNFEELFLNEDQQPLINPTEIFENNIRSEKFSYLRSDQTYILNNWFSLRDSKDTIIQMNTGGGKTLVGLLQLQSSLNEGKGPAVYLCLDNNLVKQTIENAELLGINCVKVNDDNTFPLEFINSEAILVTTFQKMFNGKSIFGVQGSTIHRPTKVGSLVIDDAHSALNKVRELFTLSFKKGSTNYDLILNRFKEVIKGQGEGAAYDIIEGRDINGVLMVPYWSWLDEVANISEQIFEDAEFQFKWPVMRNYLKLSYVLVSASKIEITPYCLPLEVLPSFSLAERRIFMSATLNDDSALIKDFGIDKEAIENTLKPGNSKDIGDKLILTPASINRDFNREFMISYLANKNDRNIVTLVSSIKHAQLWIENGFTLPTKHEIINDLEELKEVQGQHVVLANRYDGIDLADETCRVLVIDGVPLSSNLNDRFNIYNRPDSKLLNIQQAQKIEQGLGRTVRSVNDYSIVFLIGNDLVSKVYTKDFQSTMSPSTVAQIQMGKKVVDNLAKENGDLQNVMDEVVNKVLSRDRGWIQSHKSIISKVTNRERDNNLIAIAHFEKEAFILAKSNRFQEAADSIFKNILPLLNDRPYEKGWYMQIGANYLYHYDSVKSSEYQIKAHSLNTYLLKPREGIKYEKVTKKDKIQANKILSYIKKFTDSNALILSINAVLDNILFEQNTSSVCEESFMQIGNILGFECQRPEKEFNQGPDVLWNIYDDNYLIIEIKNEVKTKRQYIYKSETEQISNSYNWFNTCYKDKTGIPILVIPTNVTNNDAFGPENLKVMNQDKMNEFKKNTRELFINLADNINSESVESISKKLKEYNLDNKQILRYFIKSK